MVHFVYFSLPRITQHGYGAEFCGYVIKSHFLHAAFVARRSKFTKFVFSLFDFNGFPSMDGSIVKLNRFTQSDKFIFMDIVFTSFDGDSESSETLVLFYQTTRYHILEDISLPARLHEDFISCFAVCFDLCIEKPT
jgi:hypothetical protein